MIGYFYLYYFCDFNFGVGNYWLIMQLAIRDKTKKKIKLANVEKCINKYLSIYIKTNFYNKSIA